MNIQKYKVENISFSAQYKHITGYPRHRENRENGKKFPVRENTGNLEILPKHREFCCKFPDAKDKGYCDICCKNFHFIPEAG